MTYNHKIIDLIKSRLEHGKKEYPDDLDVNDGRDWEKETLEELLDAIVYISARLIQLKESVNEKKGNKNDNTKTN